MPSPRRPRRGRSASGRNPAEPSPAATCRLFRRFRCCSRMSSILISTGLPYGESGESLPGQVGVACLDNPVVVRDDDGSRWIRGKRSFAVPLLPVRRLTIPCSKLGESPARPPGDSGKIPAELAGVFRQRQSFFETTPPWPQRYRQALPARVDDARFQHRRSSGVFASASRALAGGVPNVESVTALGRGFLRPSEATRITVSIVPSVGFITAL